MIVLTFELYTQYHSQINFNNQAMQASLEEKQKFLRAEILDSGVDPESFMAFMGTIKEEGEIINLENWSLVELKEVVQEFKKSLQQQINRAKKQISAQRGSKQVLTNKIMQSIEKKQKVFYDRDDLWDYEMHTEQQCKKIQRVFQFKTDPEVDYKAWDIKKTGGFLFGIGAKNQLQVTLITNFTANTVTRRSEDVDWLRETLCVKYPGSYIPPLEQTRFIEPDDKASIIRRVKQIILFLNSLVNFEHLAQNKYFYMFIQQKDTKVFNAFRAQQTAVRTNSDITTLQNLQGKFTVQISKRVINFIKDSSQFGRQADQIYISLQANMRKILGDLETLTKHTHYVANDFAKFHDKYNRMSEKCKLGQSRVGQKMSSILVFLNNMYTNMGNQFKKHMSMIKQMTDEFIRYSHSEWSEFILHQKRYNHQLNNYLSTKYNLIKKKERSFNDISKWELDEKQQFRMSRMNTAKMDRQQAYEIMFPKDNRIEQETRIWQAYINDMYEKTFKILISEQQRQFIKNYSRLCQKLEKLSQQQSQTYKRFQQIFGTGGKGKAEGKIIENKQ